MVLCVVNMKLCQYVLIQQVFKQIGDIQNIDSFEHKWKIFDTHAIVTLGYEHILLVDSLYNMFSSNREISTSYWPFS
jgi:hypothetical protein